MRTLFLAVTGCLVSGCLANTPEPDSTVDTAQEGNAKHDTHPIEVLIKGTITQISDPSGLVNAALGDAFTGSIRYTAGATDTGEGTDNSAIYRFDKPPAGFTVSVHGVTYETDPTNVDLLINVVDRPEDDHVVYISYRNKTSNCNLPVDTISWQLDDATGTALDSIALPLGAPTVASFTQDFGMTISGGAMSMPPTPMMMPWAIRGVVTEATLK